MATYLKGGVLIDCTGNKPLKNAMLAFDGKLITYIGQNDNLGKKIKRDDTIIELNGKTVLPGLINMHDHLIFKYAYGPPNDHFEKSPTDLTLFAIKNVLEDLRHGITTIREMASLYGISLALRNAIQNGELIGPRIFACNQPICATGGHASEICVEADGPDNIRRAARDQLRRGADFIKVMASHDPYPMAGNEQTREELTLGEIQAAFEEAHKWGKRTACHAMGKKALENVVEAGVSVIDHGAYMDKQIAKQMVEKGIFYTPTLSAYTKQTFNPKFGRGKKWASDHNVLIKPILESFRFALEEGVKIVCGTDSTGRYAEEVELMRQGGMGAMESLMACTKVPAEALGLDKLVGTIEIGKQADMVVLNGDPLRNPYALEKIELVIKEGKIYRLEDIRL